MNRTCILNWLDKSRSCPTCQNNVTRNSLLEVLSENVADHNLNLETNSLERILLTNSQKKKKRQSQQSNEIVDLEDNSNVLSNSASADNPNQDVGFLEQRILSQVDHRITSQISQMQSMISELSRQISKLTTDRAGRTDAIPNFHTNADDNGNNNEPDWGRRTTRASSLNLERDVPTFIPNEYRNSNNLPERNGSFNLSRDVGKVANLISSWKVQYNGSRNGMPVGKFIYMITALTNDSLRGNFEVLCEHIHILFSGRASEWFCRYRRTVDRVNWSDLCKSLNSYFLEPLSDDDVRELIRDRKQQISKSFDEFHNGVMHLVDRLQYPISESQLTSILKRNLRPFMRKELFYIEINSVSQLRKLVLRREALSEEYNTADPKANTRKQINALEYDQERSDNHLGEQEICELKRTRALEEIQCWNCRRFGHKHADCQSDKKIFYLGCGAENIIRPNCETCQENRRLSGNKNSSYRSNPQH
ncbi:uncharacterized protein LOC117193712 isoform X2 [Drosophila miranda]|uniref:uncharacterized protein LOC117193712 isoform X2 n=1 Tax=Drosophila miranda TaxID=7229 RepID=UPI00143F6F2C|nr:uncharacterized protein LOC117193712 isoform X2 [Drosophila miranda]